MSGMAGTGQRRYRAPARRRWWGGGRCLLALLFAAGLTACGNGATPAPSPAWATTRPVASLTDMVWAQLTVAMDERATQVLDLVPGRAADAGLIAFASDVASEHGTEVERIGAELDRIGVTSANPHAGHDMPGMASAATLADLRAADGARFDRLAIAALRDHFDHCRTLVEGELMSGTDPVMMSLAREVDAARKAQLANLAGLGRS